MIAIDTITGQALVYDMDSGDLTHLKCCESEESEHEPLNQDNWEDGEYTCIWCDETVKLKWQDAPNPFLEHYL